LPEVEQQRYVKGYKDLIVNRESLLLPWEGEKRKKFKFKVKYKNIFIDFILFSFFVKKNENHCYRSLSLHILPIIRCIWIVHK